MKTTKAKNVMIGKFQINFTGVAMGNQSIRKNLISATILALMMCLFILYSPNLHAQAEEERGADAIDSGKELVNMDFPELTDIKDIIRAVSLWTGKNVILDRNVNGKVQIISPKKVTKEEAYQAFLSALNVLNLTTVETGKVIKILPVRTAQKSNLKTPEAMENTL